MLKIIKIDFYKLKICWFWLNTFKIFNIWHILHWSHEDIYTTITITFECVLFHSKKEFADDINYR